MIVIGLTGGIGSGKTTIAKMFDELGIPVYFSDDEAKKIMNNSSEVRKLLIAEFGKNTYLNGELNRKYLAKIVFNDKVKLLTINNIVHPEVKKHFKKWIKHQHALFVIQESALIFENKKQNDFDKIITITAPLKDRLQRVKDRDNVTNKHILDRIKNQLDDEFKVKSSDYVIHNVDLMETKSQVRVIYDRLMNKYQH
jgi:dephospho-CoA kinase